MGWGAIGPAECLPVPAHPPMNLTAELPAVICKVSPVFSLLPVSSKLPLAPLLVRVSMANVPAIATM